LLDGLRGRELIPRCSPTLQREIVCCGSEQNARSSRRRNFTAESTPEDTEIGRMARNQILVCSVILSTSKGRNK
jgi:hypothetical protein